MKTKLLTLALLSSLLLGVQTTHAQDSVYSNVVGMVKKNISPGNLELVHIPFIVENENMTVEDLFGDSVPTGTSVFLWEQGGQEYKVATVGRNGWSGEGASVIIDRAYGIFISIGGTDTYEVVFSGNVPSDNAPQSENSLSLVPGLNMVGFPYPTKMPFSSLELPSSSGDSVSIWSNNAWLIINYGRNGWSSNQVDLSTLEIDVSQSFFYFSNAQENVSWEPTAPYSLN